MTIQCCSCERVQVEDEWNHRQPRDGELVSHTYCPECLTDFRERLQRQRDTLPAGTTIPAYAG